MAPDAAVPLLPLVLVVGVAIFTKTVVGFGLALVAMPILVDIFNVDLRLATPLVLLLGLVSQAVMLARYRAAFNLRAVARLGLSSWPGIVIGVFALRHVDSQLILVPLGVVVTGYALYALFVPRLPKLTHPGWAYGLGFVAGVLGGAYNTSGPPVIIYGNAQGWGAAAFKGNMQGFFFISTTVLMVSHAVNGSFTPQVWAGFLLTLPAAVVGMAAGFALDRYINPVWFRRAVLVVLVVLGLRLIF
jgi:uncharacterized membrane protein YfcA